MRLKERKLNIDACRSAFFTALYPDKELSLAAAKTPFSNKWAESQKLNPVEATNRFFDQPRSTADILDSINEGKKSGKPTRIANAHFTNEAPFESPSVDELSQESVSDPCEGVPRTCKEAADLERQNGNTRQKEAIDEEPKQLRDYETFIDKGLFSKVGVPSGHQLIKVMWVFAVKHDGRYEARLVANGNLTAVPLNSVHASIVSLRGLRSVLFLTERNGLETWATDIENAHIEIKTHVKACIKAVKAFGHLEGHLFIIQAALHGLRSSGRRFGDLLTDFLKQLGFFQSKAEP